MDPTVEINNLKKDNQSLQQQIWKINQHGCSSTIHHNLSDQLEEKKNIIVNRDTTIEELNTQLEEKNTIINQRDTSIKERNDFIEDLEKQIDDKNKSIEESTNTINGRNDQIIGLKKQITELQNKEKLSESSNQSLTEQINTLNQTITQLRSNTTNVSSNRVTIIRVFVFGVILLVIFSNYKITITALVATLFFFYWFWATHRPTKNSN